jgi:hypothetical protein
VLHNWLPDAGPRSTAELLALALTVDDARDTVSREHGFAGWRDAAANGRRRGDATFERAVEDLLGGDLGAFGATLVAAPELVVRRSHYGHRATLLHYVAANGVEIYRQRVPRNVAEVAALLLAHGADPRATAWAYGRERTTRQLLVSSGHPHAAGVTKAVLAVLDGGGV